MERTYTVAFKHTKRQEIPGEMYITAENKQDAWMVAIHARPNKMPVAYAWVSGYFTKNGSYVKFYNTNADRPY